MVRCGARGGERVAILRELLATTRLPASASQQLHQIQSNCLTQDSHTTIDKSDTQRLREHLQKEKRAVLVPVLARGESARS